MLFYIILMLFLLLSVIILALFFGGQLNSVLSPITGISEKEISDKIHAMPVSTDGATIPLDREEGCAKPGYLYIL